MITLDERTGSAELLPYFAKDVIRLGRLEFGDASFLGMGQDNVPFLIGVERKTLNDLVQSMKSGRLQGHQLPGLLASYKVVYLVVEGITKNGENHDVLEKSGKFWRSLGVTRKALDSFLNTLEVLAHVIVRQTTSPMNTAILIHNLYLWWQKGWEEHKGHLGFALDLSPTLQLKKPSMLRRIAKELPGIGWERSLLIEKHFKTVQDMANADRFQWELIPGIGRGLSMQLSKVLKEGAND